MLSEIVLVANLLMLAKGAAIEVPLSKVLHSPTNAFRSINRRNVQSSAITLDGGTHTAYSSYIAEIKIGDHPYKLTVDTGSSDLLVVGHNCATYTAGATCNAQTKLVGSCTGGSGTPNTGTSTGKIGRNCYGAPGLVAFAAYNIYKADVTIAGVQAYNQHFGYIYKQTTDMWGGGPNPVDGVLGLAYSGISEISKVTGGAGKTLMSTLSTDNSFANSFAMCFDPSGTGGKMIIGGGALANMQFTPLTGNTYYRVTTSSISINGITLPNTADLGTIVDSGSTDLIVPKHVFEAFASQLCPILNMIGEPCLWNDPLNAEQQQATEIPDDISVTPEQLATLPKITISLPGATLVVPPESYYRRYGPDADDATNTKYIYFFGIVSNNSPVGTGTVIIGDVALMGHWVYFDMANSRVGFSSVENCDQQYLP